MFRLNNSYGCNIYQLKTTKSFITNFAHTHTHIYTFIALDEIKINLCEERKSLREIALSFVGTFSESIKVYLVHDLQRRSKKEWFYLLCLKRARFSLLPLSNSFPPNVWEWERKNTFYLIFLIFSLFSLGSILESIQGDWCSPILGILFAPLQQAASECNRIIAFYHNEYQFLCRRIAKCDDTYPFRWETQTQLAKSSCNDSDEALTLPQLSMIFKCGFSQG